MKFCLYCMQRLVDLDLPQPQCQSRMSGDPCEPGGVHRSPTGFITLENPDGETLLVRTIEVVSIIELGAPKLGCVVVLRSGPELTVLESVGEVGLLVLKAEPGDDADESVRT